MTDIRRGDGVVLFNGRRGIVLSERRKMTSYDPNYYTVYIRFEGDDLIDMPVDERSITEVWRAGVRVADVVQLELM